MNRQTIYHRNGLDDARTPTRAAAGGGFILATADAIMVESAYGNMMTMIKTCHEFGHYPIAIS